MRYQNTKDDRQWQRDVDDLIGSPTLDRPIPCTRFPSMAAATKEDMHLSLRRLATLIEGTEAAGKEKLPWFKLAVFGDERTPLRPHPTEPGRMTGNSLRHDANVISVSGVEAG